MLFVADLTDGTLEIVDGAQRISTLEAFVAGDLALSRLAILENLNGFTFEDLPISQQRKLRTRALRVVVMEEVTSLEIRQELFRRINTQGVRARGSEIRRGSFAGPFIELIKNLASDPLFRRLCPISPSMRKRREDEELVTRFLAYSDDYRSFRHDVDNFLDNYVDTHRANFDGDRMREEFHRTMQFVRGHFPHGFAKASGARRTRP